MRRILAISLFMLVFGIPAEAQQHLNPSVGDVWTYFGPSLGDGWGAPTGGGGGGNPAGSNGAIQFNNAGSFGGSVIVGLVLGNGVGSPTAFPGATCTNQFLEVLSPTGLPTCMSVGTAFIANSAVTYPKLQNESASTLLGNPTGSPAAPSEITLGTNLSFSGNVLNATGGGGGGGVSVTAAVPAILINPSPGTGTFTIGLTTPVNDLSTGGGAIGTGDNTKLDKLGAFTYTLATAGSAGFTSGWSVCFINVGSSNATITTTTSVFVGAGGSSTLALVPGAWACPTSDGSNWQTVAAANATGSANISITQASNGINSFSLNQSREEPIGWIATVNPNNATVFTAKAASTVTSIVGRVETATGAAATVSVNKAPSGTACSAGTALHSGSFNANGTAATNQTLTLTTTALASGDSVCLQTTGTTAWTGGTGIGGITVSITTP